MTTGMRYRDVTNPFNLISDEEDIVKEINVTASCESERKIIGINMEEICIVAKTAVY